MTEEKDPMGLSIRARFLVGIKASKRLGRIGRDIYVGDSKDRRPRYKKKRPDRR